MPKMRERELVSVVEKEFESAMGAPGGQISRERAKAFDYYQAKPIGNEVDGESQVVTSDVSDVVDGIMPGLLKIFASPKNLVNFDPVGPEDKDQARQESDYVNYVFFKKNNAFTILYNWFFDALVQKNGIVKAWWDDAEKVSTETYKGLTDEQLTELMDDDELEPVERDERTELIPTQILDPMSGQPVTVELPQTVHDIKFKRTSKRGFARVDNVPPEEYRISSDARSLDPCEARMVGQVRDVTRSELLEMGFDKKIVDSLPTSHDARTSSEEISRKDKTDELNDQPHDRSQDKIEVKEAYIRVDFDGDGRSELRQVIVAGNRVLSNEEADRQPFHVISPKPLPHKHFGIARAEEVMDTRDIKTTVLRGTLNNIYRTNQPSHAVWEQGIGDNTLDDLLTSNIGSIKRFARPPQESYMPITVPFTAGQTFPMVEYLDKVNRERTGVGTDGDTLNPEALKNIQQSVLTDMMETGREKLDIVGTIFAETGIKSLFMHIHELLAKHQTQAEVVELRNEFVSVDPSDWRTRYNTTLGIGLGVGSRRNKQMHLEAIWDKQAQMVQGGGMGVLVTPQNIYNTAAEMVQNANFKDPEQFFTNPGNQPVPEGENTAEQLAQAQLQLAQREQDLDRERDMLKHEREMLRIEIAEQSRLDKKEIEDEKIANELTKMELESDRNIPGSKV